MQNKNEYLDAVCAQIRFRAARKTLRRELEMHIDDRTEELIQKGENYAEQKAVDAMGDAVQTGKALNAVHRPRMEWRVILTMLVLSAVNAFKNVDMTGYGSTQYLEFSTRLIMPMIIGFIFLAVLYFFNYSLLAKLRYVFYCAAVAYILVYMSVHTPDYSPYDYGIWLNQSPVIVFSTAFFMLGITGVIAKNKNGSLLNLSFLTALSLASVAFMYLLSSVYAFLLAIEYIAAFVLIKRQQKAWRDIVIYGGLIVLCYALCASFMVRGHFAWETNIFSNNQNQEEVIKVLSSAKMTGASSYYINSGWNLESSQICYVITAIIGAYGWLAGLGVVMVFGTMGIFMVKRTLQIANTYGQVLSFGISVYFVSRFVLCLLSNIGVIGGYISLSFLSSGDAEFVTDAGLLGIFLSVWRRSTFMKDGNEARMKTGFVAIKE